MGMTPLTYDILLALADSPRHGYGIIKEIESRSAGAAPSTGALYLALQRMEGEGLVEDAPSPPDADARRRYYRITSAGMAAARAESERLALLVAGARAKRLLSGGAA
jgi:DNA-binding PadR family transcriptional regulator